jgi:ribonuclease Z
VREDEAGEPIANGVLLREAGFRVRTPALDHGIPSLAFALEERAHINICRNRLAEMGLAVGSWLRSFRQAILSGAPEHVAIEVAWSDAASGRPRTLPLGELRQRIMQVGAGRKITYVVDAAFTPANTAAIIALARGAPTSCSSRRRSFIPTPSDPRRASI